MERGDRRVLSPEDLASFCTKVKKLRDEGLPDSVIASRMGFTRTTIVQRMKRYRESVPPPPPASPLSPSLEGSMPLTDYEAEFIGKLADRIEHRRRQGTFLRAIIDNAPIYFGLFNHRSEEISYQGPTGGYARFGVGARVCIDGFRATFPESSDEVPGVVTRVKIFGESAGSPYAIHKFDVPTFRITPGMSIVIRVHPLTKTDLQVEF